MDRIFKADLKTEIMFNCQMGRGRTTTGMVIATLVYFNRIGASGSFFASSDYILSSHALIISSSIFIYIEKNHCIFQ